jgi:hypothetical protein
MVPVLVMIYGVMAILTVMVAKMKIFVMIAVVLGYVVNWECSIVMMAIAWILFSYAMVILTVLQD